VRGAHARPALRPLKPFLSPLAEGKTINLTNVARSRPFTFPLGTCTPCRRISTPTSATHARPHQGVAHRQFRAHVPLPIVRPVGRR